MWRGWYYYPQDSGQQPVSFEMVLIQDGATVVGFIKEPNTFGERQEPWLHSVFKGSVDEQTGKLTYTKTYDGTAGPKHDVVYSGQRGQDKTKVEGMWDIGGFMGRFTLEKVANTSAGSLSGVWSGTYHYPQGSGRDPVNFNMIVIHQGKSVTGFMKEPNTFGQRKEEPWLHAIFKGTYDEQAGKLTITKTYDGTAGENHDVEYRGQAAQDRAKVEGTWAIGDNLTGTFTLQRLRLDAKTLESLK
jgi:translation elongation factor EF-G